MKRLWIVLLSVLLAACSSSSEEEQDDTAFNLNLTPDNIVLWEANMDSLLTATLVDSTGGVVVDANYEWSSADNSIVEVDADGRLLAIAEGETVVTVKAGGQSAQAAVTVSFGAFTVDGVVRYQDKEYSSYGLTGNQPYLPLRGAVVEVLDTNNLVVASTITGEDGTYSFVAVPGEQYSVHVLSLAADGVEVRDLSGNTYSVARYLDLSDLSTANIDIAVSSGVSGAFNIFDVFSSASEFAGEAGLGTVPAIKAYWQSGNTNGTHYCSGYHATYCQQGEGIYVLGGGFSGDADEYDDDVLWHEYGHFIAHHFSRDDSPGGCHVLTSTDLDLRLAWSEGWGDFFPAAIKSWLAADAQRSARLSTPDGLSTGYYIDTVGNWAGIALDISQASSAYRYAANEVAVANILWHLDQTFGMQSVWSVMNGHLASTTSPTSLETFWDGWINQHLPTSNELTQLHTVLGGRQVFYRDDEFEGDDAASPLRVLEPDVPETHYLYRQNGNQDVDIMAFAVQAGQSYRIETQDLTSGADTYLRVTNAQGGLVAENDDALPESDYYIYDSRCDTTRISNNGTALASAVEFTASETVTYYAYVQTTPDAAPYPSAGRYGSYSIRLSPL